VNYRQNTEQSFSEVFVNKIQILGTAILSVTGVLYCPSIALAEEITCQGTLGRITVDSIRVPQGATCNLNRTTVQGTIKVESRATLNATRVRVIGNIQAENARSVIVRSNSTIGGSIQIIQSRRATVANSQINQDLQFESNTAQLLASNNRIGGNLQAFQNSGGLTIQNNRIDGNLQCKENNPAPTGGGNVVQGSKEDQCAAL
jgi:hypothetical protein